MKRSISRGSVTGWILLCVLDVAVVLAFCAIGILVGSALL